MKELEYPFDATNIIKEKKQLKRILLNEKQNYIEKKVAILGGATTKDIRQVLELFLLNCGIRPTFYESEYNKYYEDGMFPNPELESFAPEIIYVCTGIRNITDFPQMSDDKESVDNKRQSVLNKFYGLWDALTQR